jgi:hypothetical protein
MKGGCTCRQHPHSSKSCWRRSMRMVTKGCSTPYIASAETFTSPTCAASSKILCAHVPHAKGTNWSTYTQQAFSFCSPFQQRSGRTLVLILWRCCHESTANRSSSRWWIASTSTATSFRSPIHIRRNLWHMHSSQTLYVSMGCPSPWYPIGTPCSPRHSGRS